MDYVYTSTDLFYSPSIFEVFLFVIIRHNGKISLGRHEKEHLVLVVGLN